MKDLYKKIYVIAISLLVLLTTSCLDDLNRYPTNDITGDVAYADFNGYKAVLAKVYGAYAQTGHDGPSGKPDVQAGDGATADFFRCVFNLQCMTTEEAICTWTDVGIPDLNYMSWSANNAFVSGMYYRSMYIITIANEFLRESTEDKVSARGITGSEAEEIKLFRAEVRFLRAYQYWNLMDLFGNPPYVDENTPMGTYLPEQIQRPELFKYIESELKEIETELKDAKTNEYGRVDKAGAQALLARMYLNAKVYTGAERNDDAVTYANKILDSDLYSLKGNYEELFMADNNQNNPEVILSINYDGKRTQGWGGLTYVISASFMINREDVPGVNFQEYFGMGGLAGWYGNRSRKELPARFDDADKRKLFFGRKSSVDDVSQFLDGLAVAKFRNVTSEGESGSNYNDGICDTDLPIFRLAEIKFIYAEAVLRGATNGTMAKAIEYMNDIRERAFGNTSKNYTSITLQNILDERSRELYWEGFRRSDLVRFGQFTSGSNLWQWKGGVKEGVGTDDIYNLFPIPATDLMANPNLKQNAGY